MFRPETCVSYILYLNTLIWQCTVLERAVLCIGTHWLHKCSLLQHTDFTVFCTETHRLHSVLYRKTLTSRCSVLEHTDFTVLCTGTHWLHNLLCSYWNTPTSRCSMFCTKAHKAWVLLFPHALVAAVGSILTIDPGTDICFCKCQEHMEVCVRFAGR